MAYRKWTQEDFDTIVLLTNQGLTARQVAEVLRCSEDSVKTYKVKLGLSKRKSTNLTDYSIYLPKLEELGVKLINAAGIKGQSTLECAQCGTQWKARIWDVCDREQACQNCASKVASKVGNKWLDSLGIQIREYKIPGTNYAVDGYDPKSKQVYEFLGDFWHGNLNKYDPEQLHPKRGITFEELFIQTTQRLQGIKDLGYQVMYIWESDWKRGEPAQALP